MIPNPSPIRRFRSSQPYREKLEELNNETFFQAALQAIREGIGTPKADASPKHGEHVDVANARQFSYMRGVNDTLKLLSEVMIFENAGSPSELDPDDLDPDVNEETIAEQYRAKNRPKPGQCVPAPKKA